MKPSVLVLIALAAPADTGSRRGAFDPERSGLSRVFRAGDDAVFAVSVARGAGLAAAGRRDGQAIVWDAASWKELRRFEAHAGYCYAAVFSPDGRRLATCGLDGAVKLWETATGAPDRVLRPAGGEARTALAWASGGRILAAGGPDGAQAWPAGGGPATAIRADGTAALAARGDLVAAGGFDGRIVLWDLARGREAAAFAAHEGLVSALAFHPGGEFLASGGVDGALSLWDLKGARRGSPLEAHPGGPRSIAFTPDGAHLVSGGRDGAKVWDLATGRMVKALETSGTGVFGIALGLGGREIVGTGGDSRIRIWGGDLLGQEPPAEPKVGGFLGVSYVDGGGALVQSTYADSQAEKTGFQANDVITGVDGTAIERSDDFLQFMRKAVEGDEVFIRLRRGTDPKIVRVKLGRWPER